MISRFFLIVGLIVTLDQLTKAWIVQEFSLHDTREIIPGFFSLTYLTNTGAAFGMFAGSPALYRQVFFISVAVIALIIILIMLRRLANEGCLYTYSLALIAGGAIGNVIDRVRFGSVIDFLDVYIGSRHWPAFNVADSAITVGAGMFLLVSFLADKKSKQS